jgi:hypothetical protein
LSVDATSAIRTPLPCTATPPAHQAAPRSSPPRREDDDDEAERVLVEIRQLVEAEKDEALLLQLCAHHLSGAGGGTGLREALIHAATSADLTRRLSLLAALQAS